jgi:hypothetical protein
VRLTDLSVYPPGDPHTSITVEWPDGFGGERMQIELERPSEAQVRALTQRRSRRAVNGWRRRRVAVTLVLALAVVSMVATPAHAEDVGYVDQSFTGVSAPTGEKPQSKLWIAGGTWWGTLWDTASQDYHIFRFNPGSQSWTDTGVLVDERASASPDAFWDGTRLYVVSAGRSEGTGSQAPRIYRFSLDAATQTWSRDSGFPVIIGNGGTEAVTLAKDSSGTLWVTYAQGAKVYLQHSVNGDDKAWTPRYQLPTPDGEADVTADDIAAVVAYDGNKVGVMFSNQQRQVMYFASHIDGTSDQTWSLEAAFARPEGADDHMNLKSLQGDASGRVFAAVKASLDLPTDPEIHLLALRLDGTWTSHPVFTVAEGHTRGIVLIDSEHRRLHVFAAAPCCSGGVIYTKSSPLDNIRFDPGMGTPFIANGGHTNINNPTSTKQNLDSSTGLLVLAGDDTSKRYLHNHVNLGSGPTAPDTFIDSGPDPATRETSATFSFHASTADATFECSLDGAAYTACSSPTTYDPLGEGTHNFAVRAVDADGTDPSAATRSWRVDLTPPDTTITSGPSGTVVSRMASFTFTATEPVGSFACRLDSGPWETCTSPKSYAGLQEGPHVFEVAVTDQAGNPDPTPASRSWTIDLTVFADDFESGGFAVGGWTVQTGGAGTAAVVAGAGTGGSAGAQLSSTTATGSFAYIQKTLAASQADLTVTAAYRVTGEGASGRNTSLLKLYNTSGTRILTLQRDNVTGLLQVNHSGTSFSTGASLALNTTATIAVRVVPGPAGAGTVEVKIGGMVVYQTTSASLGTAKVSRLRLGNDATRVAFAFVVDDVRVTL